LWTGYNFPMCLISFRKPVLRRSTPAIFIFLATLLEGVEGARGSDILVLEPVTVTATKQTADLYSLPQSISVFDAAGLDASRITNIDRLSQQTPALVNIDTGTPPESALSLRGLGSYGIGEPSVGFFLDGAYLDAGSWVNSDLFDIERIEVLKGPQQVLFGKSSVAGAINIITREPGTEPEARLSYTLGEFGRHKQTVMASHPVGPDGGVRLSAMNETFDGRYSNSDGRPIDSIENAAGRIAAMDRLGDTKVSASLQAANRRQQIYPYRKVSGPRDYDGRPFDRNDPSDGHIQTQAASLKTETQLDELTFTTLTATNNLDEAYSVDLDYSRAATLFARRDVERTDASQEIRLSNGADAERPFVLGLYAYRQREHFDSRVYQGGSGGTLTSLTDMMTDKTTLSVFAQGEQPIAEDWRLTAGLRLDHDWREQPGRVVEFTHLSPRLAVMYGVTPHTNLYASAALAHKAGGFNPAAYADYGMETIASYEAGVKTKPSEATRASFAAFVTEAKDQQVTEADSARSVEYIVNKGSAIIQGLEGNVAARLSDRWTLDLSAIHYLRADFDDYSAVKTGPDGTTGNYRLDGNRLNFLPRYQIAAALDYEHELAGAGAPVALLGSLRWRLLGPQYWDDFNTRRSETYDVLDLSFGVRLGAVRLRAFADNVFDRRYFTNFTPAYRFTAAGGSDLAIRGQPRQFGVELTVTF